jgi:L-amino acid N-acyltransferase YncA
MVSTTFRTVYCFGHFGWTRYTRVGILESLFSLLGLCRVADISVYIDRNWRGKGLGSKLLQALEGTAKENGFHKLVLFTFPFNQLGQGLYRKAGFREVGVFQNQGKLDGTFVDVMAMEKLL